MKIQITSDGTCASVSVDGVTLNNATAFHLMQKAGEIPVLTVELATIDGLEVELPDGVVIAQHIEAEEQPPLPPLV